MRIGPYFKILGTFYLYLLGSVSIYAESTDPLQSGFFVVDDVKIHYFVQGTGEPVILIHAWLTDADSLWVKSKTMEQLANSHHRVVALDLAGYGESEKPSQPAAYGDAWVEQVYQLMNHLEIPKAHIVGYSMGSMVGLKFIVVHQDRVLTGLLGGMGYLPKGSRLQQRWAAWSRPQWAGVAQLALTPNQVNMVHVPVELVLGSRDPTLGSYVEPLLEVRNDWPIIKIPGKGHLSTVGSQEFKDAILDWLAKH